LDIRPRLQHLREFDTSRMCISEGVRSYVLSEASVGQSNSVTKQPRNLTSTCPRLVLMPSLWSERGFYQTISLIIFLVVAYGLHGRVWNRVPKSFVRAFDAESAQTPARSP
jgi:hypothetical protein